MTIVSNARFPAITVEPIFFLIDAINDDDDGAGFFAFVLVFAVFGRTSTFFGAFSLPRVSFSNMELSASIVIVNLYISSMYLTFEDLLTSDRGLVASSSPGGSTGRLSLTDFSAFLSTISPPVA